MSLRLRLNILLLIMNLGFLSGLSWLEIQSHRASIEEEITAAHRVTVQMLHTAIQTSRMFGSAQSTMVNFLEGLGRIRANDIRFYSADGELRYNSPPSTYKQGRNAPEWFTAMMWPQMNATSIGVVGAARIDVIPEPSRAILDAWDDMAAVVILGLFFFVALHVGLSVFLRHLLRPTEDDAKRLVTTTQELAENREVILLIQAGIEEERKRLSRELHDELGQSVTAIRLIATSIARRSSDGADVQNAGKINEIATSLYDSVLRIVRELRPAVLEQPDLPSALNDLAREWRTRHGEIELALRMEGDLGDLGEALILAVFRSVQEALTNVLKHSGATRVDILVRRGDRDLELEIADNGDGAGNGLEGSGHGLVGMRERIFALGGTLDAGPRPTGGFCVRITLPLSGETR